MASVSGTDSVRRQFGRTAAAYVESATHARGEDLDRIERIVREHGGARLVDVGTGVGHTLRRLAPLFRAAVGVDATREMLDAGRGVLAAAGVAHAGPQVYDIVGQIAEETNPSWPL